MTFLQDVSAASLVLWIIAIILVLGAVYRAWPWIRKAVRTVDALGDLPDFMERIKHQVENDHSTNLRDEITEILTKIDSLSTWQQKHQDKSDAIVVRIESLERKAEK